MNMTEELRTTVEAAISEARERRHEYVTLEHLLLAMAADPVCQRILQAVGAKLPQLVDGLEGFLGEHMEVVPPPSDDEDDDYEPKQTIALWRVFERAAIHLQGAGRESLDAGHVLASLLREKDCFAVHLLEKQGVTRLDVVRFLSHGIEKLTTGSSPAGEGEDSADEPDGAPADPLAAFAVDLITKAEHGRIDPLVGRTRELSLVMETLARRRKNNPLLVGDPGVGKTAIVEGLALAIHENRVPEALQGVRIFALDMGGLVAGTKYRGEFEQRLKAVVNAITSDPKAILFIDEIHTIVGAGAVSSGSLDASNLLKPALASGELRCIGSTTHAELKASFGRDRALARRFQEIEIDEPSVEDSLGILHGLRSRYEEHHRVKYHDEALARAAELSHKYLNDRRLPDKAIDVIDQAGAANSLLGQGERREEIGPDLVESVLAKMAKIPPQSVSATDEEQLRELEPSLKQVIFGQDDAIEALVAAIKLSRAGLGPADRPIGSFLLSGPTGVGKTEMAKQLAATLGVSFLRFDMSEYMEKHTVSRLIGAPPGYVGFDQGGLLTDAIRRTPHAVLLLDEIEKAHPDVFNILLQVMDHATLTDNNGRKADFRHVVLLMTTNAGGRELTSKYLGFSSSAHASTISRSRPAIERLFSPEFRNRLDAWIVFEPLARETVRLVVDKLFAELAAQLAEKDVTVELRPEAREWLAEHGYEPDFGARPMRRLIEREIKRKLIDDLLFGALRSGGHVVVDHQPPTDGDPKTAGLDLQIEERRLEPDGTVH